MDKRDEIKNNPFLTPEEKESSLNLIAMTEAQKKAILESDKSDDEKNSDLDSYDLIIEEIINKSRRIADKRKKEEKKNREKEKAEIKNKLEVLSYLKNENGEKIYSKAYLKSMSNEKIKKLYSEFERKDPSLLKKAREEIVRPRVYRGNVNRKLREKYEESNQNIKRINNEEVTLSDVAKSLGTTPEELIKEFNKRREYDEKIKKEKLEATKSEAKKKEEKAVTASSKDRSDKRVKALKDVKDKYPNSSKNDELTGQTIVKEEDGSRFTKFKRFVSKHKKAILIGAALGVLGGIALYYALKHGDASATHDAITTMKGAGEALNIPRGFQLDGSFDFSHGSTGIADSIKDGITPDQVIDTAKEAVTNNSSAETVYHPTGNVFSTVSDLVSGKNSDIPNEWYWENFKEISGYITGDGIFHEGVYTVDQLKDLMDKGIDIVGARTGNPDLDPSYSGFAPIEDVFYHASEKLVR